MGFEFDLTLVLSKISIQSRQPQSSFFKKQKKELNPRAELIMYLLSPNPEKQFFIQKV